MARKHAVLVVALAMMVVDLPVMQAEGPAEIPIWTKAYLKNLGYAEKQLVDIAKDFPEDQYHTYRPTGDEDTRTPAEILLHVAHTVASYGFSLSTEEKKQALAEAGKMPNAHQYRFVSKDETVTKVKAAFALLREAILETPNPEDNIMWLYVLVHSSEHFGNLVVYYRNLGLVPPTSRQ